MRKSYIHRDAEAKHSVIVFFSRVVRNDHAVRYNKSWVFWPAWKQTHWMSGIHDERLLVRHCHQVMKREPKLEIKYRPCVFTIFFFLFNLFGAQTLVARENQKTHAF